MSKKYTVEDILRLPGEGEQVGNMNIKVHSSDLGNYFGVMENVLEPKQMIAAHLHQEEYQALYVISGELEFEVGGADGLHFTAPAGSYMFKPRRLQHAFWNAKDEPARYIELSSGVGFEDFIYDAAEVNDPISGEKIQRIHQSDFDMKRTIELMKEHGLTSISGVEMSGAATQ